MSNLYRWHDAIYVWPISEGGHPKIIMHLDLLPVNLEPSEIKLELVRMLSKLALAYLFIMGLYLDRERMQYSLWASSPW